MSNGDGVKKLAALVSNLAVRVRNLYGQGPATSQQISLLGRDLEEASAAAQLLEQKTTASQLSNFALQARNLFVQNRFTRQAIEFIAQELEKEAKALDIAGDAAIAAEPETAVEATGETAGVTVSDEPEKAEVVEANPGSKRKKSKW